MINRNTVTISVAVLLLNVTAVFADKTPYSAGVIVRIGCEDPEKFISTSRDQACIVHGLYTDAKRAAKARDYLQSKKRYGRIFISTFDGKKLPYAENIVNAVVTKSPPSEELKTEITRVLVPQIGRAHV